MATAYIAKIRVRTERFTRRLKMSAGKFKAQANKEDITTIEQPGYVEVLRDGHHVARYLKLQRVLWYEHEDDHQAWLREQEEQGGWPPPWIDSEFRPASVDDPWPPACPECGGAMRLKFSRRSRVVSATNGHSPFWSCVLFDSPGHVCRGKRNFTLHPEELAEYQAWRPSPDPDWSPRACKTYEQSACQWKWEQLAARSLERVQPAKVAVYA